RRALELGDGNLEHHLTVEEVGDGERMDVGLLAAGMPDRERRLRESRLLRQGLARDGADVSAGGAAGGLGLRCLLRVDHDRLRAEDHDASQLRIPDRDAPDGLVDVKDTALTARYPDRLPG